MEIEYAFDELNGELKVLDMNTNESRRWIRQKEEKENGSEVVIHGGVQ